MSAAAITFVVSPHGYGHAARAAAVMSALLRHAPDTRLQVITRVPRTFFEESVGAAIDYVGETTDVGMVQRTALEADMPATIRALDQFLPFREEPVTRIAAAIRVFGSRVVVADIAPIGIVAAAAAGVRSVLVENFTWHWIYEPHVTDWPALAPHVRYLERAFAQANAHIQSEPLCAPVPCTRTTPPVARDPRSDRATTRAALDVPHGAPLVLISMGGVPGSFGFLDRLRQRRNVFFVVPGGAQQYTADANLRLLPHHSAFYHPDLVQAADAVVGKNGYSTISEIFRAGVPFGFVPRLDFREAGPLGDFIRARMPHLEIRQEEFLSGDWLLRLDQLLAQPRRTCTEPNGADAIAGFLLNG